MSLSVPPPRVGLVNEIWAALGAAFLASGLTILGTWWLNQLRDRREDERNHRAEMGAAVHEVASLSYDVSLRAHHAKVFSTHYSSPLTTVAAMLGAERSPDLPSLVEPMLETVQQLGAANSRLWLCGDQELVAAGNMVQVRTADVIDALMGTAAGKEGDLSVDAVVDQLAAARRALVSVARDRLGLDVIELTQPG